MPESGDSSSDSDHTMPFTPPSDDDTDTYQDQAQGLKSCHEPKPSSGGDDGDNKPYVPLDPEYMKWLCWSNDPADLYLGVYFNPNPPNLPNDFKVAGLRPVVKEIDSDTFILQDAKKRYYFWDAWDGHLRRVKDTWTKGFNSNEEIVENLIVYQTFAERDTEVIYADRKKTESI